MLELITEESLLQTVAERYKDTYYNEYYGWKEASVDSGRPREEEYRILKEAKTREDALKAFSNAVLWLTPVCEECEENVDAIVELGLNVDYTSTTYCICRNCLEKALTLISEK